ncbi:hypothetical protein NCH01_27700 [Neoasaia chiangmaiensis]|nr:hypothetical protein NCH01_27700 [Neoasaia chiangmaiensis]
MTGLLYQIVCANAAYATYCEGASRMGCYRDIDHSGRSPDAMYASAPSMVWELWPHGSSA